MTVIPYCDCDPRCWSLHLEQTYLLIMVELFGKFAGSIAFLRWFGHVSRYSGLAKTIL